VEWLAAQGIRRVGDRVRLELRELDVDGLFQVMAIKACPEIAAGPGRVVTAVFSASRGAVWNLGIAGESAPIGVTEQHPFWSLDRNDWVPAGKLRRGERMVVVGGRCGGRELGVSRRGAGVQPRSRRRPLLPRRGAGGAGA